MSTLSHNTGNNLQMIPFTIKLDDKGAELRVELQKLQKHRCVGKIQANTHV